MRILGISLGTREGGVAILDHGQLIEWQMHTFHGRWSEEKLQDILRRYDRYITLHRIRHVVIKIPPATHHSGAFLTLLKQLSELVQYRGCMVACQTKADIKAKVPEVANTEALMAYVVRQYPILLPEQAQECSSKRGYRKKMFEAVLAAHVYRKELVGR